MGAKQKARVYLLIASLQAVMAAFLILLVGGGATVSAAVGVNAQLSFEGKIVKADGTNITNGTYNMQFKIYQDGTNNGTGSTLKWTENRLVGGTGGVTLTDGTFQVNLGSANPFGTSVDWNQDTLWLSMQIGNTSSCTITTSFQTDCAGDGEMTPYIRLTAVPQALNSNMLGGLVAGNFVQLAQGLQADSSTTNASIAINKTGTTANILQLQKAGSDVLVVGNDGSVALTPAAITANNGTAFSETAVLTNSTTNGIQVGHYIEVQSSTNTVAASDISLDVRTVDTGTVANKLTGIMVSFAGTSNTAAANIGIDSQPNNGIAIRGYSTAVSPFNQSCGNISSTTAIGVCGYSGVTAAVAGTGVIGITGGSSSALRSDSIGNGVYGSAAGSGQAGGFITGVKGVTTSAAGTNAYNSTGVFGQAKANSNATTYGGYFTLDSTSASTTGAALYASNSSIAENILQLQDNTTDVLVVKDGGDISLGTTSTGSNISFAGTGNISNTIRKNMTVTGAVNANDVVIVDGSNAGNVKQSTGTTGIIFGVATTTNAAGPTAQDIVIYGVYQINVASSSGVINVGDSLDISSTVGKVTAGGCDITKSVGHALSSVTAGAGGTVWAFINPGAGKTQGGGSCASAVSPPLQTGYNTSTGGTTPEIKLDSTRGALDIQDANTTIGASLFTVHASNSSGLGTNLFDVQSTGLISMQPAASLTAGQTALTQSFTNGSSTGSAITGLYQNITVNNTVSASNTYGQLINISDSTTLSNTNRGIAINMLGSNTSQSQYGIDSSATNGAGVKAVSSGAGSISCGGMGSTLSIGVCGSTSVTGSNLATGVYGATNSIGALTGLFTTGAGIYGNAYNAGSAGNTYIGTKGTTWQNAAAAYTSVAVQGLASAGTGATMYGGYFGLDSGAAATSGSALFATNSSISANILQLQDNSADVLVVGDGGATTIHPNQDVTAFTIKQTSDVTTPSRNIFQVQNSAGTSNYLALNMNGTIPHLKVFGANGTDYADIYYDSGTSTAYYGASTGTSVLGSGTGPVNVTAGAGAAANITGNAASTWQTTAGLLTVQGGAGILLSSQGTNTGTTLKSSSNSVNAFQVQSSTSVTGMAFDTSNFHLQVYDPSNAAKYVSLYYDDATSTAIIGASSGTVQVGGNTGPVTISTSGTDPVNITANGNSTWQTAAGNLTISSAAILELQAATNMNISSNGVANTIQIGNTTGAVAQTVNIGNNSTGASSNNIVIGGANSSVSIDSSGSGGSLIIGSANRDHVILLGTGVGIQSVQLGSVNSTSKTTLQGGILTTTNNNSGIVVGSGYSSSDTSLTPLTLDSSATFTETASTCTSSVNGGTIYYNSTTNALRACVGGSNSTAGWEDLVSSGGLGLLLFGIVPDSPVNLGSAGDLAGLGASGANSSGPCKVYLGSTTATIRWTSCEAYSGGRKVIVAAQTTDFTVNKASAGTQYVHMCLNGTGNQVAQSAAGAENAGLPTFSANSPVLCLADVQVSTTAVTGIYDVRTFITSQHDFANITTATTLGLGVPVITSGSNVAAPGASATANLAGVISSWGGATTGTPNAILTVSGPTWAKATGGTAGAVVIPSATAGRVATGTSVAGPYGDLGLQRSATWSATCTAGTASTCQTSIYFNMILR